MSMLLYIKLGHLAWQLCQGLCLNGPELLGEQYMSDLDLLQPRFKM